MADEIVKKKRGRPPKPKPVKRDENGVRLQVYQRAMEGRDYDSVEAEEMAVMMDSMIFNVEQITKEVTCGAPRKYPHAEDFLVAVKDYAEYIKAANNDGIKLIPDIEGLCAYLGISRETLNEWEKSRDDKYRNVIRSVKNQIAYCKKQLALKGKIPPIVFATDFNNNHGYTQKQELAVSASNPLGDTTDAKTIEAKYDELPPG